MKNPETISGVVTATVAVLALIIAIVQIWTSKKSQRIATAKAIYREYLKLCFDNPDFSYRRTQPKDSGDKLFEKYAWFVSNMLFSCEEIYLHFPYDEKWKNAIILQCSYHSTYLNSEYFKKTDEMNTYSERFVELVDESIKPNKNVTT
jgi:hypothetical protein